MSTFEKTPEQPEKVQQTPVKKILPLWHNRDYMLLWGGQVISSLGTQVSGFAFPLLLLALTHSPLLAGLSFALHSIPYLLFSLPAGALVDRWDRKRVMISCDVGRTICLASVPLAAFLGVLTPWLVYSASLVEGILFVFFNIAEAACLPRIVPKSQLAEANAQNLATESIAIIFGPVIAGAFYTLSRTFPFLADAISYAVSFISLSFIKTPFQEQRTASSRSLWREVSDGISWIWRQPLIRFLALVSTGRNFVGSGFVLLVIVLAQKQHISPFYITFIFTIGGFGSVAGSLLAPVMQKKMSFGLALGLVSWWLALLIPLYLLASSVILLGTITAGIFIGTINQTVLLTNYRQTLVPDNLQGRVNSVYRLVIFTGQPLGALITGWLLQQLGVVWTIWIYAFIFGIIAIAVVLNPHVRHTQL
jgi:MFS family permease